MPFIAVALEFKAAYARIEKEVYRAQRRALLQKARAIKKDVAASIARKGGGPSAPGHPFRSFTGNLKKSLHVWAGGKGPSAIVGYTRPGGPHGHLLETTGRKKNRRTGAAEPRPTLGPALEREKSHPFRGISI